MSEMSDLLQKDMNMLKVMENLSRGSIDRQVNRDSNLENIPGQGRDNPSSKSSTLLACTWEVYLNGNKLSGDKKARIEEITITETVDGADYAVIKIYDTEYEYIEDDIFIEDSEVKIELGWTHVDHREKFEGFISQIEIDFPENGVPVLTVTCMDNTHKMNRQKKDRTFTDCTSADVVQKIAGEYGFKCVVESDYEFTKQETITQSNQSDIDFLTKLAGDEVYPFTARLSGDTFYYVMMGKLETPVMTLKYNLPPYDVISFTPRVNKEIKEVEVSSSTMTTSSKETSTTTTSK